MKFKKHILATLLAIALALTLALPAMAADEPDPAMPVITVQPVGSSQRALRATFVISVQAHIPNGDDVGYTWYRNGERTGWAGENNGDNISVTLQMHVTNNTPETNSFYVVVHNLEDPERSVTSQTVQIELLPLSFSDKARIVLGDIFEPVGDFFVTVFAAILQIPLLIIAYPFAFLFEALFGVAFFGSLAGMGLYELIARLFR